MKYRLIAIDLDGTVINQESAIIPSARKAIQRAIDRGIKVTLATGRMYKPSDCFAQELGISAPLICYQGALIREPGNGNILWHKPLPVSIARRVIEAIRQMDIHQYVYVDDEMYVEEVIEKDIWYSERNGVQLNRVEDLVKFLKKQPTEIAARDESAKLDRMIAHLNNNFDSSLNVTKVHSSFCEIGHADSGKGNALKYLAKLLGIEQSQTVAIGDGPNDISMLKWAGLGIVEDGFAQAMERLLNT